MHARSAAFATGAPLPRLAARPSARRGVCRASASVEAVSAVTVTVDNSVDDGGSVIRLRGQDKPALLRRLAAAVVEAGFAPTRINVPDFVGESEATSEFVLAKEITLADVDALREKVQSVWADAAPHAPEADPGAKKGPLPYEFPSYEKMPEAVVEKGLFFNVDPYAHADWTTLTAICPVQEGIAEKMMAAFEEEKLNIIFATIRSVDASDSGVAPDIYLLQTADSSPLGEIERVNLNNRLVKVLVSE